MDDIELPDLVSDIVRCPGWSPQDVGASKGSSEEEKKLQKRQHGSFVQSL